MADLTPEQWTQIESELAAGRKISAVKLYRQFTGVDLYNAKLIVEEHHARLQELDPQTWPKPKKGGCGTQLGMLLVVMVSLALLCSCQG
jgi:hypothetical protein